ncbi:hypothetical protein DFH09DRAFT_1153650, partial [Mycena vulgaris]
INPPAIFVKLALLAIPQDLSQAISLFAVAPFLRCVVFPPSVALPFPSLPCVAPLSYVAVFGSALRRDCQAACGTS